MEKDIYPSQINVENANQSDNLASYLDLTSVIERDGNPSSKLYNERDDFVFNIVNFPFLSSNILSGPYYSNIQSGPFYGVYISQLLRYVR